VRAFWRALGANLQVYCDLSRALPLEEIKDQAGRVICASWPSLCLISFLVLVIWSQKLMLWNEPPITLTSSLTLRDSGLSSLAFFKGLLAPLHLANFELSLSQWPSTSASSHSNANGNTFASSFYFLDSQVNVALWEKIYFYTPVELKNCIWM